MLRRLLVPIVLATAAACPLHAQSPAPAAKRHVRSIQPVPALLAIFAGEYERVLSPTLTVGAGGTAWSMDGFEYASAEVKARYYPSERAPAGFSIGGSVGVTRATEDRFARDDATDVGPSLGVLLNHRWLLGRERGFYVGLGLGAKRVYVDGETFTGGLMQRYPTYRLAVGYAF
jgi:hypothetical protein